MGDSSLLTHSLEILLCARVHIVCESCEDGICPLYDIVDHLQHISVDSVTRCGQGKRLCAGTATANRAARCVLSLKQC